MDLRQARTLNKDGAPAYLFLTQTMAGESHANLPVYFCFGGDPLLFWPWGLGQAGNAGAPGPVQSVFFG